VVDFGFDKLALIGAVALIVIGPEKLPRVARTVGHMLGKAQRYVAEVKAEVNRSIELDELKKMKTQFEDAARDVERNVNDSVQEAHTALQSSWSELQPPPLDAADKPTPQYKRPNKRWRLKRGATPLWYKQRNGIRTRAQSGAARVARFRPPGIGPR
jgi:sec-independent protein translocase protein TatB